MWVGKIPWRRAQQPTPVFLPGEPQGQRSLAGYAPWDRKEADITEATEQAHMMDLEDEQFSEVPNLLCPLKHWNTGVED